MIRPRKRAAEAEQQSSTVFRTHYTPAAWTKGKYGGRSATHVQRLRAGIHVYRGGPGIFPGAWLFIAEALQTVPSGQEERATGRRWRRRVQSWFIAGHKRDLRRMRTADHGSVRAPWGSSRVLPELLSGAQDQRRWWRRQSAWRWRRLWRPRPLVHRISSGADKALTPIFGIWRSGMWRLSGFFEACACSGSLTKSSQASVTGRNSPICPVLTLKLAAFQLSQRSSP